MTDTIDMNTFYVNFMNYKGIKRVITKSYLKIFGLPVLGKRLRFKCALELLGEDINNAAVLDAGCTIGDFAVILLNNNAKSVTGVDITPDRIEYAEDILKDRKFTYKNEDLLKLKTPKKNCDLITGLDILEHIEDDITVLKNFSELLKDGGAIVLSFPSIYRKCVEEHERAVGHVRKGYSVRTIKTKLNKAGLKLVDYKYADPLDMMYLFYKFTHPALLALIFPPLYLVSLVTTALNAKKGSILAIKARK